MARDLRALGAGAPVRAGLEASKRCGGHALLFRGPGATARLRPPVPMVNPVAVPDADAIPDVARERTRRTALTIVDGTVELFGQHVHVGADPDWHARLDGPGRWPLEAWWKIDIRSDVRTGDVKWVWELGRHHHLVVLARAAYLEPNDPRWRDALETQLTSWITANPCEMGIHWYSNLEIALRSIAWLQILALAGDQFPPSLSHAMEATLHHNGRHLLRDLPYTLSTMRNNHLVGDALGLAVLGRCFPGDAAASRWAHVGDRLLNRHLPTQVHDDGSMIEDSLSYHRFVLEMLCARALLGASGRAPDADRDILSRSARFLTRLGVLEGEVPRYGDGDEGRVLTSSGPVHDFAGSTALALALAGSGTTDGDRAAYDECAWYAGEGTPADADPAERRGRCVGDGMARAQTPQLTVWLKAGGGPSHGHADLCSSMVRAGGEWVVGDPGTGTYNGPIAQRNHFRASVAHNVTRVDGLDQREPHRAFRWRHPAVGAVGDPLELPGTTGDDADSVTIVLWGWHGCYSRLEPGRRVVRAMVVEPSRVTVADWIEGPTPVAYELAFPLAPATELRGPLDQLGTTVPLVLGDGHAVELHVPEVPHARKGIEVPFDGWWSEAYGSIEPATRLDITGVATGPIVWSVECVPGDATAPASSAECWHADGADIVCGALGMGVEWRDSLVHLRVRTPGGERVASAPTTS